MTSPRDYADDQGPARLESLYHDVILDHAKHPHGAGLREPYDAESHQVNPTCGDDITLRVMIREGRVADVSYAATGCAISQAAASVLTELLVGESVTTAKRVEAAYDAMVTSRGTDPGDPELLGDGVAFAGVARFPQRVKCALLPWMAFRDALGRSGADPPDLHQTESRQPESRQPESRQPASHQPASTSPAPMTGTENTP